MTNAEISSLLNDTYGLARDNNSQNIPLRTDGTEYRIDDLAIDQKQCLAEVLHAVRQYCEGGYDNENNVLRLTVSGSAGSGKSTLINTLVTCMRRMFPEDDTISVFAPTGAAAFNAGGQTLHAGFLLPRITNSLAVSSDKQKELMKRYKRTLVIVIDERSMLDATILGTIKHYMQQCAHGGMNNKHPWGGIPIIILVGDDYQLPSIHPGAFYAQDPGQLKSPDNLVVLTLRNQGFQEFLAIGERVISLDGEKRVNEEQDIFRRILRASRCEDESESFVEEDKQRLLELHLNHPSFADTERKQILDEALYIFAKKEPRDNLNSLKLKRVHSKDNPVARIKSVTQKPAGKKVSADKHFDTDRNPNQVLICRGARVSLNGYNAAPDLGLYHGSLGIVRDIVYDEGQSPATDDFPSYVLVEFPEYCGKELLPNLPKYIPVVPHTVRCNFNCCLRTYIPLALAYGKTAHTFQGQTVGPVPPGRPPNPIKKIIVDPGDRGFEGKNVGLFYQLLSRATTIGVPHDKLSSAIYFDGSNFNRKRFENLTMKNEKEMYKMAMLRKTWVSYLRKYTLPRECWTELNMKDIFHWAESTVIRSNQLTAIIEGI